MAGGNGKGNGAAHHGSAQPPVAAATSDRFTDLAEGCVRFVREAVGVQLDYSAETLPVLDHYLRTRRDDATSKPETLVLVAQAAGAYVGEVVRRRHSAWWRADSSDPLEWRLEFEAVFLLIHPIAWIAESLSQALAETVAPPPRADEELDASSTMEDTEADAGTAGLWVAEEDRAFLAERLAQLPNVTLEDFVAPSTRVEVVDIAVEALRARSTEGGAEARRYSAEDYADL